MRSARGPLDRRSTRAVARPAFIPRAACGFLVRCGNRLVDFAKRVAGERRGTCVGRDGPALRGGLQGQMEGVRDEGIVGLEGGTYSHVLTLIRDRI